MSVNNISPALKYWHDELTTKEESTRNMYEAKFAEFLQFIDKNPDELIVQRQQDLLNKDIKIQRRIESQFLEFLAKKKKQGYAIATLQIIYASIRSFFEIHYFPLRMRRGDYPKGDSDGVKRATKEALLKILYDKRARNKATEKAIILFLKDSGLRLSDARRLNYGDIAEQLEQGATLIQINVITQKTKLLAKTFIGQEAIEAIKAYIEERKKGSKNVEPEIITNESPLFRTWMKGKIKRIPRGSFSSLIRQAFLRNGEKKMSAHSLRKKLQTDLEKAGINSNWIDQILGHQLINSRDAYSLPTDEELKDAYLKAYPLIRIYPEAEISTKEKSKQSTVMQPITVDSKIVEETLSVAEASNMIEVKQLLAKGYKYEMDFNGVKLFTKSDLL